MSEDALKKHGAGHHDGPASTSPYPISRLAPAHSLVDTARQIQEADAMLGAVVGSKLTLLAKQIQALQEQARAILAEARRDSELHRAGCNFVKRPGAIYHLYRRLTGDLYFSMLSPDEWGGHPPDAFEGSYRLEYDQSWTPAEQISERTPSQPLLQKLLGNG